MLIGGVLRTRRPRERGLRCAPRLVVGSALCLALGCGETIDPISLDIATNCNKVEVSVLSEAGGLIEGAGERLVATSPDGLSESTAWALVLPEASDSTLLVRHLGEGRILAERPIPIPASIAGAARLHAAPQSGEVYLSVRLDADFRVWRVVADEDRLRIQGSAQLAVFPDGTEVCGFPCPTGAWYRDLVFVAGEPFVVSVPPFSPNPSVNVAVSRLRSPQGELGELQLSTQEDLPFGTTCDPALGDLAFSQCQSNLSVTEYPAIEVVALQRDASLNTATLLATRQQTTPFSESSFDLFAVVIGLDGDGDAFGILRSQPPAADPMQSSDATLATDPLGVYARVVRPEAPTELFRLDVTRPAQGFARLPVADVHRNRLLQLDRDLALGRLIDGAWHITKLFPDALAQSQTTVYRSDSPIDSVRGWGPAVFELRHQGEPSQIVRVACSRTEPAP